MLTENMMLELGYWAYHGSAVDRITAIMRLVLCLALAIAIMTAITVGGMISMLLLMLLLTGSYSDATITQVEIFFLISFTAGAIVGYLSIGPWWYLTGIFQYGKLRKFTEDDVK